MASLRRTQRVVVILVVRLHQDCAITKEVQFTQKGNILVGIAVGRRTGNHADEDEEQDEVESGETNNSSSSELGLLHRVDGWANLATALNVSTSSL